MYLLFRYHHILPADYYNRKAGEKRIIHAFLAKEIEDRNKEIEAIEKAGG
ncbi:MAG TPA: hypothetical protein GXX41_13060 [Thermoanaerobacterium sp.]|nr:hypothetical protein [Thermoanaerobacterium sp.]